MASPELPASAHALLAALLRVLEGHTRYVGAVETRIMFDSMAYHLRRIVEGHYRRLDSTVTPCPCRTEEADPE